MDGFLLWEWYIFTINLLLMSIFEKKLLVFSEALHQQKEMSTLKQPETSILFY
jgi:hypothetical protein